MSAEHHDFVGFLTRERPGSPTGVYERGGSQIDDNPRLVRYERASRKPTHSKSKARVLRRLQGFLLDLDGAEARVAFVQDHQIIQYDIPAENLRKIGVLVKNQPFQMDEIEMSTEEGLIVGYRFQALAKSSDAYIEHLSFDGDRRRKRDLILAEFAKTKVKT